MQYQAQCMNIASLRNTHAPVQKIFCSRIPSQFTLSTTALIALIRRVYYVYHVYRVNVCVCVGETPFYWQVTRLYFNVDFRLPQLPSTPRSIFVILRSLSLLSA